MSIAVSSAICARADTATPNAPLCARPNVPAHVLRAADPDLPPMAEQQGIQGSVAIVVSLDENSRVTATRVQSSPSAVLNQAALAAARATTFQTEVRACKPIAADYIHTVDFAGQPRRGASAAGEPTIEVNAQGVARRAPDVAYVTAVIATNDDDAAVAASRTGALLAAVTEKLRALGVDDAHMRTTSFSAFSPRPSATPAPNGLPSALFGHYVSRTLTITVAPVAKVREVAGAVVPAGAKWFAIQYDVLDREPAYREALGLAMKDARARAQVIAGSGGHQLGKLLHVGATQSGYDWPPAGSGIPVPSIDRIVWPPEDVEVRAGIIATYAIKQ